MEEMFRLKIDGGRKTTIPQHLLNLLRLRENTATAHTRSAEEKAEFAKRVESVRAGDHDSEEELLQAIEGAAIGVGRT